MEENKNIETITEEEIITIDGVDYKKLEISNIQINGVSKNILSAEDTQSQSNLSVNIVIRS